LVTHHYRSIKSVRFFIVSTFIIDLPIDRSLSLSLFGHHYAALLSSSLVAPSGVFIVFCLLLLGSTVSLVLPIELSIVQSLDTWIRPLSLSLRRPFVQLSRRFHPLQITLTSIRRQLIRRFSA
jgi:hypothetical protein